MVTYKDCINRLHWALSPKVAVWNEKVFIINIMPSLAFPWPCIILKWSQFPIASFINPFQSRFHLWFPQKQRLRLLRTCVSNIWLSAALLTLLSSEWRLGTCESFLQHLRHLPWACPHTSALLWVGCFLLEAYDSSGNGSWKSRT